MPLRVLAALVALLLIPATASASYDGSTGKVAYVDTENGLYIDDPFDDQPAQGPLATVASEDVQTKAMAMPSPPAWSPDGTLLAYSAPVDDSFGMKHSAIFVMKADGTGARQVSHPFALEPDTCYGQCDNGHASLDHSPTWTPDGKIAFIRMVYSGDESPRVSERGTSVRVVDPAGGAPVPALLPRAEGPRPDLLHRLADVVDPPVRDPRRPARQDLQPPQPRHERGHRVRAGDHRPRRVAGRPDPRLHDAGGRPASPRDRLGRPRARVVRDRPPHAPGPLHARRQLDRPQGLRQGPPAAPALRAHHPPARGSGRRRPRRRPPRDAVPRHADADPPAGVARPALELRHPEPGPADHPHPRLPRLGDPVRRRDGVDAGRSRRSRCGRWPCRRTGARTRRA